CATWNVWAAAGLAASIIAAVMRWNLRMGSPPCCACLHQRAASEPVPPSCRAPGACRSFAGLAVEMFLGRFGVGPGLVHRPVPVLGGRIEGVEPLRLAAGIDDVVAGARRHDDRVVAFDLRAIAVDQDLAFALLDAEELIAIVMHLF